jgi:hypothetical protein
MHTPAVAANVIASDAYLHSEELQSHCDAASYPKNNPQMEFSKWLKRRSLPNARDFLPATLVPSSISMSSSAAAAVRYANLVLKVADSLQRDPSLVSHIYPAMPLHLKLATRFASFLLLLPLNAGLLQLESKA